MHQLQGNEYEVPEMQVSAIGGGLGAMGGISGAAGVTGGGPAAAGNSAAAGASGTSSLEGTFLKGTTPAGMEALSQNAEDLGNVSLLFTLIILALLEKGDKDDSSSASVLGFLAGFALASQLGQSLGSQSGQTVPATTGAAGLGGQLDLQA